METRADQSRRRAERDEPYRTLKLCSYCSGIAQRKAGLKPQYILKKYIEVVGEAYIDADLVGVEIADKLLAAPGDIFLWGNVGVGKTWAMAALVKHFLCEGFNCKKINLDAFCREIRATMNSQGGKTEDDLIKGLVEVDKLVIDDIGLRSKIETDFVYGILYSILDKRQERKLSTYLSSNKTTADLASTFDMRIESRLSTTTMIEMIGPDRRKLKT
jgi:DNA replication protein DnaC